MSDAHREPANRSIAPAAAGKVSLSEIIEIVATPDEAAEYAEVKSAAKPLGMFVPGAPETDYERRHRLCRKLQNQVWARILPRLTSGEWAGGGYTKGVVQRVQIPTDIWPELQCDFTKDKVCSNPDLDLQFSRVVIDTRPTPSP
jgi:hypothetical protein